MPTFERDDGICDAVEACTEEVDAEVLPAVGRVSSGAVSKSAAVDRALSEIRRSAELSLGVPPRI